VGSITSKPANFRPLYDAMIVGAQTHNHCWTSQQWHPAMDKASSTAGSLFQQQWPINNGDGHQASGIRAQHRRYVFTNCAALLTTRAMCFQSSRVNGARTNGAGG
jgi:hypothetical protein